MKSHQGLGLKQKKTFFYVGDIKQSIYRFRGGQKELFNYVLEYYKNFGMEQNYLDTNYRSKNVIVDFVNNVFKLNPPQKSKQ